MQPILRLDHVTKRFGSTLALDDVCLEVPPGVVFALLGENGAGKTTAIRILLGLLAADAGRAQVLGLDSARQGLAIRRRVGYVPERPTLYEWMTVAEIGWFTAGFYGDGFLPEYRRLAAGFGLPEGRRLQHLSKGMRAKVVLALALALDPELLVLDEPTSGLDALVRREFLESMVDRAATGKTVLLSSHQIHEVERVADVVAVIRQGRLLLVRRLDDLKAAVRQLTITLADGSALPRELVGEVLSQRQHARQWQLVVRNPAAEDFARLRAHPAVRGLEVRGASLEEIFMATMQPGEAADPAAREATAP